jgi:hypothetical protein
MPSHPLLPLVHKMLGYAIFAMTGTALATVVDFSKTVTLGSVLLAVLIAAIAGGMTIRSKVARVWRDEADGQRARADRLQADLEQQKSDRVASDREQSEARSELKAQIAALEAKTDLTGALEAIRVMNADLASAFATRIGEAMAAGAQRSEERDVRTHELLEAIRDRLPDEEGETP